METYPWARLEPQVADLLRPELPAVVARVIAAIGEQVPAYARPLEGAFGHGVRTGVEVALSRFLALLGTAGEPLGDAARVYSALGAGEAEQGRSLAVLLAAYRVGARTAWQGFAAAAERAEVGLPVVTALAEAIFAYIDELSAVTAEGYARAQSELAGERDRRRADLASRLARGPLDPLDLADLAAAAGWALP
ncbi:MAG: hypothetical protein ACYDB7_13145, partial [Mycobacteriales bacterium]